MKFKLLIFFLVFCFASCKVNQEISTANVESKQVIAHESQKFIILTADDFGASKNVNEGIEYAANIGAITSIEAMTNFGESLGTLKQIQVNHPKIDIGIHLNITTGKPILPVEQVSSLVDENGDFYDLEGILPVIKEISLKELRLELEAQIQAATTAKIEFNHFSNQHNILSLYSPFFDVILDLAKKHQVALRSTIVGSAENEELYPDPQTKKRGKEVAMSFIKAAPIKAITFLKYGKIEAMELNDAKADSLNILRPDRAIDYFYETPTSENLLFIINTLPDGVNEVIFHLGTSTRELSYPTGLNEDYFLNREYELSTLTSAYIQDFLKNSDIEIIGYRDLNKISESFKD